MRAPPALAGAAVLLLLLCSAAPLRASSPYTSYAVVIDAGGEHSTAAVYQWPTRTDEYMLPVISPVPVAVSDPSLAPAGLYTLANRTAAVGPYLLPLLEFAQAAVPLDEQRLTALLVYVGGAAARGLAPAQQAALLNATRTYLLGSSNPFNFVAPWAQILSEEEEAAFNWLAANSLQGAVRPDSDGTETLYAAVALAADATDVAFVPTQGPASGVFELRLTPPLAYRLYTHSYAGLGLGDDLFSRYLLQLVQAADVTDPQTAVDFPCGFLQDTFTWPLPTAAGGWANYTFFGTGGDQQCVADVQQLIAGALPAQCTLAPCNGLNVSQPAVPSDLGVVLLGDDFAEIAELLGCTGWRRADCLFSDQDGSGPYCRRYMDRIVAMYPDLPVDVLHPVCFLAATVNSVLLDVLGVDEAQNVHFAGQLTNGNQSLATLAYGALIYAVSSWRVPCDAPAAEPETTPELDYGVLIADQGNATRVYVYQWPRLANGAVPAVATSPMVQTAWAYVKSPGLSSLAQSTSLVASYLSDLVAYALDQVPLNQQAATALHLRAGTGLRQLAPADAAAVLAAAGTYLATTPFWFDASGGSGAQLLSVEEEGVFGWVTANSLLQSWSPAAPAAVVGLDAYLASATFAVAEAPNRGHYDLWLGATEYALKVQPDTTLGFDAADTAFLGKLARGLGVDNAVISVADACFFTGYSYPGYFEDHNFTFTGTSSYTTCRNSVRSQLALSANAFTPAIGSNTTVVVTGLIAEAAIFFNCTNSRSVSCLSTNPVTFCSRNWAGAQAAFPALAPAVLSRRCFAAAYGYALLRDWLNLADGRTVTFATSLQGTDLGWPLGAFTAGVGMWAVQPDQCYLKYQTYGIPDDASLLTPNWITATPSAIVVGTMAQVHLAGLRVAAGPTRLSVKLAERFQDCRGAAPGSAADGAPVDAQGNAWIGNVSAVGDYRLCFRHNQNWEPTTTVVSVQSREEAVRGVYFGTQSCAAALALDAGRYCGCYYAQLSADRYAPWPLAADAPLDVPAFAFEAARRYQGEGGRPWLVEQGCCSADTVRAEFELDSNAVWGVCSWPRV